MEIKKPGFDWSVWRMECLALFSGVGREINSILCVPVLKKLHVIDIVTIDQYYLLKSYIEILYLYFFNMFSLHNILLRTTRYFVGGLITTTYRQFQMVRFED